MVSNIYKPDLYEGTDPYIYLSYHKNDKAKIYGILEKMNNRGIRFWLDYGITPGMDTDEIIAEHIEGCEFFIAFLSADYLGFLDTLDEMNYSRDVNKEYLLIYLEDVTLPAGVDMRFMRSEIIRAYEMNEADIWARLLNIGNIKRFYGIADKNLQGKAERLFDDLEKLYPEHKVFALDAVDKQLAKDISDLYVRSGYPTVEKLLNDYGFERVSTDEARSIRSSVLYAPGKEPPFIKPRIDHIMDTLIKDYPDNIEYLE